MSPDAVVLLVSSLIPPKKILVRWFLKRVGGFVSTAVFDLGE